MDWKLYLLIAIGIYIAYHFTRFVFDVILRGFSPFISARPWAVGQVIQEIDKLTINNSPKMRIYAFNSGRSGLVYALLKKYPDAKIVGYEKHLYPFFVAKIQAMIRRTGIKVIRSRHFHRAFVEDADLIYSYISDLKTIREMGEKFKFECKPDTLVLSNGFIVPTLKPFFTLELINTSKGRFGWLSKDRRMFFTKKVKSKKENKIFFSRV